MICCPLGPWYTRTGCEPAATPTLVMGAAAPAKGACPRLAASCFERPVLLRLDVVARLCTRPCARMAATGVCLA